MTPERWVRVREIFAAVLAEPPDRRSAFLCGRSFSGTVKAANHRLDLRVLRELVQQQPHRPLPVGTL